MITNYFKPLNKGHNVNSISPNKDRSKQGSIDQSKREDRKNSQRARLRAIADETLSAHENGRYAVDGTQYDLAGPIEDVIIQTRYFGPDCFLTNWSSAPLPATHQQCSITVEEVTTLTAACRLFESRQLMGVVKVGILNFASAKKEGGGFISGAQAQEESIARTSTLYPSLMSKEGQRFYKLHRADNHGCYYTHAMIHSPNVQVIRDDDAFSAKWHSPVTVDVLTSPAVNAGVVLSKVKDDKLLDLERTKIEEVMKERMARILYLFEHSRVDAIVLGSFGTGVFRNNVKMVAEIWKQLVGPNGRFSQSFRQITFAVIPNETYQQYKDIFVC